MPNFRFKLPSRNWSIFLTIVGSWSGAVYYDRREKRRIEKKWCDAVSHLRQQTLPHNVMRRKLLVVLAGPPADGLLSAREHFHEYVRPILVAGGMDWEAMEGRKEGDIRAQVAERIRDLRRRNGETGGESTEEEKEKILQDLRKTLGVVPEPATAGDLVIGLNTWREYIRGLHEGWLGPLEQPLSTIIPEPADKKTDAEIEAVAVSKDDQPPDILSSITEDVPGEAVHSSAASPKSEESAEGKVDSETDSEDKSKKPEPKKRKQPPPFISTSEYSAATLPPTFVSDLGPSVAVTHPHILGFLRTPIRMYRFLNRRKVADDVGRQVAAAVLASNVPYQQIERTVDEDNSSSSAGTSRSGLVWEQEELLNDEVKGWHKSVFKRDEAAAAKESVWLDPIVLDDRIASRMRKFIVTDEHNDGGI
jgi:import inner membrane translocase subunit TIM54